VTGVLAHIEKQVESSRRLLGLLLAQTEAIRDRDVETLLARLGDVQGEMAVRQGLEVERDAILRRAAAELGLVPETVDLDAIVELVPPEERDAVRNAGAELRGLVLEIQRVHDQNRVLLRQELAFVDHLMRVLSGQPQAGYTVNGWQQAPQTSSLVNARA
jgi:hypothetical protein